MCTDFKRERRQEATNEFDKAFFKLMNNSCFGKTMENVRRRRNIQLVADKTKIEKLIAQPHFESFRIVNKDAVLVERLKPDVVLDKPIYAGFCILELSKLFMVDFHYNIMLKRYGVDKARLLFTDTDSLAYHIFTDDLYRDM